MTAPVGGDRPGFGKKRLSALVGLFLVLGSILPALDLPRAEGFVNDFAGILHPMEKEKMEKLARLIQEQTGAEMAVVVIDSFAPAADIEEYALELFNSWGVGQKDRDNGLLLILAMTERRVRIEVGYGLEGIIPDALAGRILDQRVIPAFREERYGTGLLQGMQVLAGALAREYSLDTIKLGLPHFAVLESKPPIEEEPSFFENLALWGVVILMLGALFWAYIVPFFFIFIPFVLFGKKSSFGTDFYGGGGFGSSGSYSSRSYSSGSRSSGGFGGGRSGGGGASRSF